jgi:hypothetical protein
MSIAQESCLNCKKMIPVNVEKCPYCGTARQDIAKEDGSETLRDNFEAGTPTATDLGEDLNYFLKQCNANRLAQTERNRFARAAIVFMAFYFESLSHLLEDQVRAKGSWTDEGPLSGYPEPLQRFRNAYHSLFSVPLNLSEDGIRDLFMIRNHIIAHPSGTSILTGGKVPGQQQATFKKFQNFPTNYGNYNHAHAIALRDELKTYLEAYHQLIKDRLDNESLLSQFLSL